MNLSNRSPGGSGSGISPVWIVLGGIGIIVGGLIIGSLTPLILPPQASAESRLVDDLFRFMLVIGGAIFLLVQGMLVFSVFRFRTKPGDTSDGAAIHGNATLEFVWTVIPAIIVTILSIYSVSVWNSITTRPPNAQEVAVIGARFAWTFGYSVTPDNLPPGVTFEQLPPETQATLNEDGKMIFSSQQLHTWVGQPVHVSLETQDVIHAFWIPGMRIKQDLVAGRTTDINFTPIEAGPYRIVCAELCGSGHGDMAGTVDVNGNLQGAWLIVHPDEETYIREFFEPNANQLLFPPEDPALRGEQILASGAYPCAACHTLTELNWAGAVGPNLNNVGERAGTRVSGEDAETYLINSLRHPAEFLVPGYNNLMPQFNPEPGQSNYMPEDHLEAIVAYLLTLRNE